MSVSAKTTPPTDAKPKEHPRGRWHCQAQVEAVKSGKINTSEYYLLGLIDALCNWKKQGCWASDDYFAEEMKVSTRHIRRMLTELLRETKGFVFVGTRNSDGGRILVTKWFLAECDGELPGVTFNNLDINVPNASPTLDINVQTPGHKCPNEPGHKCPQSNTNNMVGVKKESEGEPAPPEAGGSPPSSIIGFFPEKKIKCSPPKREIPPFCYGWDRELRRILRAQKPPVGRIKGSEEVGAEALRAKWKDLGGDQESRERISQDIADFEIALLNSEIASKLPRITRVKQFCDHLVDWIEPRIKRWKGKEEGIDPVRGILFERAKAAADRTGDYSIYKSGRLRANRGRGQWEWVEEGRESEEDAPDEVLGFIRYLHGQWKPSVKELEEIGYGKANNTKRS